MELRLQLLETFTASGSDGSTYKVCAYDRLTRDLSVAAEEWTSTGVIEYRLADGRVLEVHRDGSARVEGSDLVLAMPARTTPAA